MTYQTRARVFRKGKTPTRAPGDSKRPCGLDNAPSHPRLSGQLVVIKIGTPVRQTVPDILVVVLSTRNRNRTVVPTACHVITKSSSASVQERASKRQGVLDVPYIAFPMADAVAMFGD